jgi:hypothetical protein
VPEYPKRRQVGEHPYGDPALATYEQLRMLVLCRNNGDLLWRNGHPMLVLRPGRCERCAAWYATEAHHRWMRSQGGPDIALELCYGNRAIPVPDDHTSEAAEIWWQDRDRRWVALCHGCATRWRRCNATIPGRAPPLRITTRRPAGHVDLTGIGPSGRPTCSHCAPGLPT